MDWDTNPPEMPTVPGGLQSLQDSMTALVAKLNKIPFEGIGKDLRQTLQAAQTLLKTLDTERRARGACHAGRRAARHSIRQPHAAARFRAGAEHDRHHARTVAHGGVVPRARRLSRTPSGGADPWQAGGSKVMRSLHVDGRAARGPVARRLCDFAARGVLHAEPDSRRAESVPTCGAAIVHRGRRGHGAGSGRSSAVRA